MLLRVRLGVQYTWLALAYMLKMNKLHGCSNANNGGGAFKSKTKHVNTISPIVG